MRGLSSIGESVAFDSIYLSRDSLDNQGLASSSFKPVRLYTNLVFPMISCES